MNKTGKILIGEREHKDGKIRFREHHLIVQLKDRNEDANRVLRRFIKDGEYRIINRPENRLLYLDLDTKEDVFALIDRLNADPSVEWAGPDLVLEGAVVPGDPMLSPDHEDYQWGLECINMYEAWDIQTGNDSVVIGLLDSGVVLKDSYEGTLELHQNLDQIVNHEDLDGKRFIAGWNHLPDQQRAWPHDEHGLTHGTTMAGIIAATADNQDESGSPVGLAGMNWGSPVYTCVVLDPGLLSTAGLVMLGVQEVIDYANEKEINLVINLSINYIPDKGISPIEEMKLCGWMNTMFDLVVEAGAIICISAGNYFKEGETPLPNLELPASLGIETSKFAGHVVAVGAVTREITNEGETKYPIWDSSGRGADDMVFAPGQLVGTTFWIDKYTQASGTSIATAHVSALASLMWSEAPNLSAREIVACLKKTAKEPEAGAGYRIIDAHAALRAVRGTAKLFPLGFNFQKIKPGIDIPGFIEIEIFHCLPVRFQITVDGFPFHIREDIFRHIPCRNPIFRLEVAYVKTDPDFAEGVVTVECIERPEWRWEIEIKASREVAGC